MGGSGISMIAEKALAFSAAWLSAAGLIGRPGGVLPTFEDVLFSPLRAQSLLQRRLQRAIALGQAIGLSRCSGPCWPGLLPLKGNRCGGGHVLLMPESFGHSLGRPQLLSSEVVLRHETHQLAALFA